MLSKLRAATADESGFTLVELLVVIAILGVLAGVVVFSVAGITDDSTKSACQTEASTVRTAEEAWYAKNKVYASVAQLTAVTTPPTALLVKAPSMVTIAVPAGNKTYTLTWTGGAASACGKVTPAITP
jgi:prepilin-type N-terminal cleavage/methylation domain-containing protein